MLLRLSKRLQREFAGMRLDADAAVQSFPQTWNLDVIRQEGNHWLVLASEEFSLFSLVILVDGNGEVESLLSPLRDRWFGLFKNLLLWFPPDMQAVHFSRRNDRRIIGSQNDLLALARDLLKIVSSTNASAIETVERQLNLTPMSYLDMAAPEQVLGKLAERLKSSPQYGPAGL